MIRLNNVVGRHLLRCRLHGSKVIAHPRRTGKRWGTLVGRLNLVVAISPTSRHWAPQEWAVTGRTGNAEETVLPSADIQ